jgi:hypothetical protein
MVMLHSICSKKHAIQNKIQKKAVPIQNPHCAVSMLQRKTEMSTIRAIRNKIVHSLLISDYLQANIQVTKEQTTIKNKIM